MSEEIKAFYWIITNKRTGIITTYRANHGIARDANHVKTSPSVLEWANGDEVEVFPAYTAPHDSGQTIFCITGFNPDRKRSRTMRCFGFYYNFGKVLETILTNRGDMNEMNWYSHLVVEEFHEGVWSSHKRRWFWKYEGDEDTGGWVSCECPESEQNCSGYAMG